MTRDDVYLAKLRLDESKNLRDQSHLASYDYLFLSYG